MNTDDARETVNRLAENVTDTARRAGVMVHDAAETVKQKADHSVTVGQDYVRQNPLPTILGALTIGLIAGYLFSRREEEVKTEKFTNEPLNTARDAVLAILGPIADKLHHQYDVARDSADDLYQKINTRKNRKAVDSFLYDARRFGNHFKFW